MGCTLISPDPGPLKVGEVDALSQVLIVANMQGQCALKWSIPALSATDGEEASNSIANQLQVLPLAPVIFEGGPSGLTCGRASSEATVFHPTSVLVHSGTLLLLSLIS
jgi:hypothetical protein